MELGKNVCSQTLWDEDLFSFENDAVLNSQLITEWPENSYISGQILDAVRPSLDDGFHERIHGRISGCLVSKSMLFPLWKVDQVYVTAMNFRCRHLNTINPEIQLDCAVVLWIRQPRQSVCQSHRLSLSILDGEVISLYFLEHPLEPGWCSEERLLLVCIWHPWRIESLQALISYPPEDFKSCFAWICDVLIFTVVWHSLFE